MTPLNCGRPTRSRLIRHYIALTLLLAISSQHSLGSEPIRYGIGRHASQAEIADWDIDIKPNGEGLPAAEGTAIQGKVLYADMCEQCHGVGGIDGSFGSLVGRLPEDIFPFGRDPTVEKTVGNYWPYATTLFDYIRRAMPFDAPGSLSNEDVYSLVAYVLQENDIIEAGTLLDQSNLPDIQMPARDRFVPDDRHGGNQIR
ncbi:MAG: cytochrome c [Halioglobus sp.]